MAETFISRLIYLVMLVVMPCLCVIFLHASAFRIYPRERKLMIRLLFITLLGCCISYYRSDIYPLSNVVADLITTCTLSFCFAVPFVSAHLLQRRLSLRSLAVFCLLLVVFVYISRFLLGGVGLVGSFLRGESTVIIYCCMFIGFAALAMIAIGRVRFIGYMLIGAVWILSLEVLGKWTIPLILFFPACLVCMQFLRGKFTLRQFSLVVLVVLGTVVLLMYGTDNAAINKGYYGFSDFLSHRVICESGAEIGNTGIIINIWEGGRFRIWTDLMERFAESPVLGTGFGIRASFLGMEPFDHNAFVFLLVRLGTPIFLVLMCLYVQLLRCVFQRIKKSSPGVAVFWGWLVYLLLVFSSGEAYARVPTLLFALIPLGILMIPDYEAARNKRRSRRENLLATLPATHCNGTIGYQKDGGNGRSS